ncbi:MFS general substrate transporter [Hanseniaspora valbyensis NRRL Y-1626]|uniref:MFS general substrate transporter n=2 Tax=Hanseniaspora valbyensis NRRL Y-1626 TaxID=766949 RepID=A0A1B7T9M3_9ASCO|nr:MFS general substrate transporter [Hanseniaspora valbyensis NRRL Y-1626]
MANSFNKKNRKSTKASKKKRQQQRKISSNSTRSNTPEISDSSPAVTPSPSVATTNTENVLNSISEFQDNEIISAESPDSSKILNLEKNTDIKKNLRKIDNNAEILIKKDKKNTESPKKTLHIIEPEEEEEVSNEIQPLLNLQNNNENTITTNKSNAEMESLKSIKSIISQYEDATNEFPGLIVNEMFSGDDINATKVEGNLLNDLESGNETPINYGSTLSPEELSKLATKSTTPTISNYKRTVILMSMYLGIFLAALDVSIISTLLPHIASEFNALDKVTQIVSAYLLSSATVQPLYGKLSDIYGRKPLLIICNIIFALGCFICGKKENTFNQLIWGRILQGIGGSGLTSLATITTSDLVTLKERAYYQGIGNFFYAIGMAGGGVFGGVLNDKFNWRFSFMIQVPISILSLITITIFMNLPNSSKKYIGLTNYQKLKAIDWTGSIVLMAFLFTFSYGGSWYIYLVSIFFMLLLIKIETSLKDKEPILPVHFLKIRSIFGAAWSNFLVMATSVTLMFYLPMYWTTILNLSTTETGLRLTPTFFSTAFGSLGAGIYMKKTGKYYWFLMAFCVVGILGCVRLLFISPEISVWQQYMCYTVPGFAMSVMITINLLIMIAAVPQEDQAACTSISYAFRSTGATVGISVAGLIFSKSLDSQLVKRVLSQVSEEHPKKYLLHIIANAEKSSDYINIAPEWVKPVLRTCFHYALKYTYSFAFVSFLLASLCVSICEEYKLFSQ